LWRLIAPRVGLEPTAYRLTAGRSTIELSGKTILLLRGKVYHDTDVAANTSVTLPSRALSPQPRGQRRHRAFSHKPVKLEGCSQSVRISARDVTIHVADDQGYGVVTTDRFSRPLEFSSDKKDDRLLLGIEISGRGQRVVVSDRGGRLLGQAHSIDSSAPATTVIDTVEGLIDEACHRAEVDTRQITAAGIAFGGPVDAARGLTILSHRASGFENFPLVHLIEERFNIPTVIENDARAAALGEAMYGAARGSKDLVYIHLGTGVGAGIIVDGRFVRGPSGTAGEIGHMVISPDGPICSCGKPGHLEAYAAGPSILSRYRVAARGKGDSQAPTSGESERTLTVRAIFAESERGDGPAREVVNETVQVLGIAVANLITVLNPGVVVFGGYVSEAGAVLIEPLSARVRQYSYPAAARRVRIARSYLGPDANVTGAVALAVQSLDSMDE
jgi:glucokinase